MPANRAHRSRDEKAAELLAAARPLFLERGYAGTTMKAIAKEAGVATNVVHWYFASKDELFAAVVDALQVATLRALEADFDESPVADEAKRVTDLLVDLSQRVVAAHGLIATIHERANHSQVIAALHERTHERYEAFLVRLLSRCAANDEDLELVASALMTALEGLVLHQAGEEKCRRMLSFLISRLVAA